MPKAQQVEFLLAGVRDANGNELAAGLLYSYAAGTTTAKALYSASDKSTSHAQGVSLDGNGRLQAWGDGAYKFVIKNSAGTTVYTFDNVLYGYDDGELKWGGTSAGTGNAQTVSISTVTALSNGLRVTFIAGNSNSGAATLNVSSLGAVAITKIDGSTALSTGDIIAGDLIDVVYDSGGGGRFRIITPPPNRTLSWGGTSGGSANAQTISTTPVTSAYAAGQRFDFIAGNTNTGAATLNVNGLGAKNIYHYDRNAALILGEIRSGATHVVVYDGTQFKLLNPSSIPPLADGLAAAGTVQATAVALTYGISTISSLTVGANDGARLPVGLAGQTAVVFNRSGTNGLNVYPAVGEVIGNSAPNTPIALNNNVGSILIWDGLRWIQN